MRIPSCIDKNTIKAFEPQQKKYNVKSKLQSCNFDGWDANIPKTLQDLCVEAIAKNWEQNPILDEIIMPMDRYHLVDILSTNLPLDLTIRKIDDDAYWKKCYIERWPLRIPKNVQEMEIKEIVRSHDIRKTSSVYSFKENGNSKSISSRSSRRSSTRISQINNGSNNYFGTRSESDASNGEKTWKEYFIEMHIKEFLETLRPENYDAAKIKELSDLCSPYVRILRMDQMQCSEKTCTRIPLNSILTGFQNLKKLSLCFKQTYVGENFCWNVLKTSDQDIRSLAKGLEKLRLTELRIRNSDIDCKKIIIILKCLLKHEINILDFSHCKIGDQGMLAISKFIQDVPVKELILVNNRFGQKGMEALSYSIDQETCRLQICDIRLNQISEIGARTLNDVLTNNRKSCSIKSLYAQGCGISEKIPLGEMLKNNGTLEVLDISNNVIGESGANQLLEGLKYNSTLKTLDMRMCMVPSDMELAIQEFVHANRKGNKIALSNNIKTTNSNGITIISQDIIEEMSTILQS